MCLLKFSINVQVALAAGRPRGSPSGAAAGIPWGCRKDPWGRGGPGWTLGSPRDPLGTPWPPWECFGVPEDTNVSLKIHGRGYLRVLGYPWGSFGEIRRDRDPRGCLGSPRRDPWGSPAIPGDTQGDPMGIPMARTPGALWVH